MGDSLSALEGSTAAPAQGGTGDSLSRLETFGNNNNNSSAQANHLDSLATVDDATRSGLWSVGRGIKKAVAGIAQTFGPPQPGENVVTGSPAGRIVRGLGELGKQALQVPAAIHDINQSEDPVGTYAKAGQEMAGEGAGQALLGAATEGLHQTPKSVYTAPVRFAARTAEAALDQKLVPVKAAVKLFTPADEATGISAKVPGRDFGLDKSKPFKTSVKGDDSFPSYSTESQGGVERFPDASQQTIKARSKEPGLTQYGSGATPAGKSVPAEPGLMGNEHPTFPSYEPSKPLVGSQQDLPLVMGEDIAPGNTPKSVHPDAAAFEEKFHVPIDNYVDEAGKLKTPDFLNDIVKPKPQSPNDVINRTFGADGVDLVKKLNGGKYLDKWESNDPARANASVSGGSGAATLEKTSEVPARGYLKKVGADEGSILNGVGRTPGEHADSVNYHREQIRAGTSTPSELHVDQDGNVIGADGRHRALAAIQEHGPDAKIKVRVVQHRFQGVE